MPLPMYKEAPKPTAAQLEAVEKLKASAARQRQDAHDSFERCDTDGFLSQWASQIGAQCNARKAELLMNGGCAQFPVLCDAEGNVVADKVFTFTNKFASWTTVQKWKVDEAKYGRRWIPLAGYSGKSRVQAALGLHEESRWMPAVAKISVPAGRKNTGLAGCANASVFTFRADDPEVEREIENEQRDGVRPNGEGVAA
jgi:hypothetical protein